MEGFLALVAIFFFWGIVRWLLRAGIGTVKAAAKSAAGKGSFSENFQANVIGLKPIEVRLHNDPDSKDLEVKEIQIKGLLPLSVSRNLKFVTSVFDETNGELEPVLSGMEQFQEPHTLAYQHTIEAGHFDADVGFITWVRVGVVIPKLLVPSHGGNRKFKAIIRMLDADNAPDITNGFNEPNHSGSLWAAFLPFEYQVLEKGYVEAAEERIEARAVTIQLAIAIAMWDGNLSQNEGSVIKAWIEKTLAGYRSDQLDRVKRTFNDALRSAYNEARKGTLSIQNLIEKSNKLEAESLKYETIELCYSLLATRGSSDEDSARIVDLVAKSLNLNTAEVERIRDLKIMELGQHLATEQSIHQLLGIEPQWDEERIKRHLRAEFQKWNNRINSLSEGEDRDTAQRMLDAISDARKKYG